MYTNIISDCPGVRVRESVLNTVLEEYSPSTSNEYDSVYSPLFVNLNSNLSDSHGQIFFCGFIVSKEN